MRCFLTAVLLVAVLSLIGTNTAQTSYAATIGINMADGTDSWSDGYVSGTQNGYSTYSGTNPVVTTPVYAQAYWYNIAVGGGAPIVNLPTTGIRDSSGTLLGTALTFSLNSSAGPQQVGSDLNGVAYAAGTPGMLGVGTGDGFTITGIPYSSYDVAVLTGLYYHPGTAWSLITGNGSQQIITGTGYDAAENYSQGSYKGQITGSTFAFTNFGGDHTVFAVQILNTSVVPEPSTFALCGMGLLVLGCVGLQRKFRQA